jgi:phenylacetate-CoA ligase
MRRFLHGRILLPLFETWIKRRATYRHWAELEQSQWLTPAELEERQLAGLRRLLRHAQAACPYYREAWAERGLDPDHVHSLADFQPWPLIDRDTIRANRTAMRATATGVRLLQKSTGGSSGTPLRFDLDTGSNDRRCAAAFRGYTWAGAGPGSKQLYLWGVPLGERSWWKRCKDALYDGLYRRRVVNCFELSQARVPEILGRLNRYRPDVLVAYTGALYEFARMLAERRLRPFAPRSIVVGAEKLHAFQRELIEEVFKAPVFETYGCREFMLIGAECDRHAGLHLTAENLLVEVLDDDGRPTPAGQEGNVVVTDLYNYGMPFVRYVSGDRAVAGWGKCPCGRGLPLLSKVTGRRLDVLQTPDGRRVPGEFFPHLIKDFPAVRRFQVVQSDPRRIQLRLVLADGWADPDRRALEGEIRKTFGDGVRVELQRVDDIPLTSAGKLRVVVNLCGTAAHTPAVPEEALTSAGPAAR